MPYRRLSPQYHCGNSWTLTEDVGLSSAQVHELPQSHCSDKREGVFFFMIFIYTYIIMSHDYYIYILYI